MKEKYIVSACLLGYDCKYDGTNNLNSRLESFMQLGICIPMCPEIIGGLDCPRPKAEILGETVINEYGNDVTQHFQAGAQRVLDVCLENNIKYAILKEKSPSCGLNYIYDGSFTHNLILGTGITTKLLVENGIKVYSDEDEPIYDAIVVAAGSSTRTKLPYNKVLEYSFNKSCIESAIEPFLTDFRCNKVIIVVNEKEKDIIKEITNNARVELVIGGNSREESVKNGLELATSKYVLIHDGARPYIKDELVDKIVSLLHDKCAIVPYIIDNNSYDYKVDGKNIQTPQAYETTILKEEISNIGLSNYRDESSFMSNKYNIEYINGDIRNKKITDDNDIREWRNYDEINI